MERRKGRSCNIAHGGHCTAYLGYCEGDQIVNVKMLVSIGM